MSSKLITFTHSVGDPEILTDVTSIFFRDETATYGMRRVDDLSIVVPAGTIFPRKSVGRYELLVTDLIPGVEYDYWIEWTFNGITQRQNRTFVADGGTPTSPFTTYEKFITRWGESNIRNLSNKDNKSVSVNFSAVQDAFDHARGYVEETLEGGVIAVPIDLSLWDGAVPARLKDWIEVLAYDWLYTSRGLDDNNRKGMKTSALVQAVRQELLFVKSGVLRLQAAPAVDSESKTLELGITAASPEAICWREPDQSV